MDKHPTKSIWSPTSLAARFESVFRADVRKWLHPWLGFDIVRFDDFLGVPDGQSTKEFVLAKYGPDGAAIIQELISLRDPRHALLDPKEIPPIQILNRPHPTQGESL